MLEQLVALDHALFLFINAHCSHPIPTAFFAFITNTRNIWSIVLVGLTTWFYFEPDRRKVITMLLLTVLAVGLSDLIAYRLIKPWVHRLRPCNPQWFLAGGEHLFLAGAQFLEGHKTSLSFPSNHAMNAFAAAALWVSAYRKWGVALGLFLAAGLVALSRVVVGVHYPLDVFAGAVFGSLLGWAVWEGYVFVGKKIREHKDKDKEK